MCFTATAGSRRFEGLFGCCSSASLTLAKKLATTEPAAGPGQAQYAPLCKEAEKLSVAASDAQVRESERAERRSVTPRTGSGNAGIPAASPISSSPLSLFADPSAPAVVPSFAASQAPLLPGPSEGQRRGRSVLEANLPPSPTSSSLLPVPSMSVQTSLLNVGVKATAQKESEARRARADGLPLVELLAGDRSQVLDTGQHAEAASADVELQPQGEWLDSLEHEGAEAEDSDWGTGSVRALLVSTGGAAGAGSSSFPDAGRVARIEKWCHSCNIDDMTFPVLEADLLGAPLSEQLQDVIAAPMVERSCPGDTWFLHFAGIDLLSKQVASDETTDTDIFAVPLERLPKHVTIVCLTDSERSLSRLGLHQGRLASLAAQSVRVVVMMLLPTPTLCPHLVDLTASTPTVPMSVVVHQRADLCANAMLRAGDALSLADGPCSLTCDDFFQELADQACELSAVTKTPPPQILLKVHPEDANVARVVNWPIAGRPRNISLGSKGGGSLSSAAFIGSELAMPLSDSLDMKTGHPAPTFIADFSMAFSSMAEPEVAKPTVSQQTAIPPPQQPRRKSRDPSREHTSLLSRSSWPAPAKSRSPVCRESKETRAQSGSRGMPTNLNGLAMMMTGGGLKAARPATNASPSRESREPREPRMRSGAGAMPTNLDGLQMMLTGGGLNKASQQKPPSVQDASSGSGQQRPRRGSSTRKRASRTQASEQMEQEAIE